MRCKQPCRALWKRALALSSDCRAARASGSEQEEERAPVAGDTIEMSMSKEPLMVSSACNCWPVIRVRGGFPESVSGRSFACTNTVDSGSSTEVASSA
eukprot:3442065-Rhodomonas_salina.1